MNNLYNEKIEALINAALADGVLTEKEKQVLFKKAQAEGIDLDEFEMVLDARLVEIEKKAASAPKSNKYGDVRKCPACGAMVPALAGACPECGFEFSGIEANLSSQKLADKLLETKNNEKKKNIIETFPIPNTKADLFEFLTTIQPRMKDKTDPLSSTYLKKYEECINKAKGMFPNDVNLRPFIESFEIEKEKKRRKNLIRNIICIAISIVIVVLIIYRATSGNRDKEKIEQAIKTGNKESIMDAIKGSTNMDDVEYLVKQLVEIDNLDAAKYLVDNKSNDKINNELYKALIEVERMDEAWDYHYHGGSIGNQAKEHIAYMSDVVRQYCKQGKKNDARQFVISHLDWFIANIDSDSYYSEEYKELKSKNVKKSLMDIINNY